MPNMPSASEVQVCPSPSIGCVVGRLWLQYFQLHCFDMTNWMKEWMKERKCALGKISRCVFPGMKEGRILHQVGCSGMKFLLYASCKGSLCINKSTSRDWNKFADAFVDQTLRWSGVDTAIFRVESRATSFSAVANTNVNCLAMMVLVHPVAKLHSISASVVE